MAETLIYIGVANLCDEFCFLLWLRNYSCTIFTKSNNKGTKDCPCAFVIFNNEHMFISSGQTFLPN